MIGTKTQRQVFLNLHRWVLVCRIFLRRNGKHNKERLEFNLLPSSLDHTFYAHVRMRERGRGASRPTRGWSNGWSTRRGHRWLGSNIIQDRWRGLEEAKSKNSLLLNRAGCAIVSYITQGHSAHLVLHNNGRSQARQQTPGQ